MTERRTTRTDGSRNLPGSPRKYSGFTLRAFPDSCAPRSVTTYSTSCRASRLLAATGRIRSGSKIFEKLQSWLASAEAEKLVALSHKFFAHAADIASRNALTYSGVSLKDIEAAQKAIIAVEQAITDDILCMGVLRDVVAMTPLGFLKGHDAVYVPKEAIAEMRARWDELKRRNTWRNAHRTELYG